MMLCTRMYLRVDIDIDIYIYTEIYRNSNAHAYVYSYMMHPYTSIHLSFRLSIRTTGVGKLSVLDPDTHMRLSLFQRLSCLYASNALSEDASQVFFYLLRVLQRYVCLCAEVEV